MLNKQVLQFEVVMDRHHGLPKGMQIVVGNRVRPGRWDLTVRNEIGQANGGVSSFFSISERNSSVRVRHACGLP